MTLHCDVRSSFSSRDCAFSAPSDTGAALDDLEALNQTQALTPAPMTATSERVRAADFYVHDDGAGRLALDPRAMIALGVGEAQLGQAVEQAALTEVRREQQRVFTDLALEVDRRPLEFSTTGPKPWPRDLDAAVLIRLDRWHRDEGFRADLFFAVEQPVREAHDRHDRILREHRGVAREPVIAEASRRLATPIPDGFGGWRDTAPPVFEVKPGGPRVYAFDEATGVPSRSLLILLHYCGEHPGQIAFATDGRLVTLPNTPKLIDPLVRMWRHDDRVQTLIVETVAPSRKAGRAVWPARYAAAIRAVVPSPPLPGTPPFENNDVGR